MLRSRRRQTGGRAMRQVCAPAVLGLLWLGLAPLARVNGPGLAWGSYLGGPSDALAKDISTQTTAVTLEGGWATLQALEGKVSGQTLAW